MERRDDYSARREHLKDLSDDQLKARFWELADELTEPLVALAQSHTSPAIERSVLLRMGFSSIEATAIVEKIMEAGLLGKGAGHVVLKVSRKESVAIAEAGTKIMQGYELSWNDLACAALSGGANA